MKIKTFFSWLTEKARYDNDKGGKFWGNLAAGVLAFCPSTKRFLVSLRSSEVNEPNTWGIIGGKLDTEEEDLESVAKREFKEETGYNGKLKLIPLYVFRDEHKTFEYHNFLGIVETEFTPILDWETEDAVWMKYEEIKNLKKKHFGLIALLKNSDDKIKELTQC